MKSQYSKKLKFISLCVFFMRLRKNRSTEITILTLINSVVAMFIVLLHKSLYSYRLWIFKSNNELRMKFHFNFNLLRKHKHFLLNSYHNFIMKCMNCINLICTKCAYILPRYNVFVLVKQSTEMTSQTRKKTVNKKC